MIILLGASGYIGQAFGYDCLSLSRAEVDYTKFEPLLRLLRAKKPEFLINAAGYTGKPNVDACESARADTLAGCALLPQTIAHACAVSGIPWGHVSSGCIYSGAKIVQNGKTHIEKDMTKPEMRTLLEKSPECIHGFREDDMPNFSFREPPCSFYSGAKALAEEVIYNVGQNYCWRLRIPFSEYDNTRNYLSKVQRYSKVYDNVNSISHRADFVRACIELWERRAPFGIYNITNPGFITTRRVVQMVQEILCPERRFEFWESDEEFYRIGAKVPRSNCVLDISKLLAAGIKIRPVEEAVRFSLENWKPEAKALVNS
jgi:dTDP-4-dehydrorhamnose reductase